MDSQGDKQVCDMYQDGLGVPRIAAAISRSQYYVWALLKKNNIKMRKPGNPDKERQYRKIDTEVLKKAVERYVNGESARVVSKDSGVSKPTLLGELKRVGINVRMQDIAPAEDIAKAYLAGKTANQIQNELGTTKRRVSKVLRENGIQYRVRLRDKTKLSRIMACKRRDAAIARATPKWADRSIIKDIYSHSKKVSIDTGVMHHVDHIYPLRSDIICGLHVPKNLRVITCKENMIKKNLVNDDFICLQGYAD